VKLPRAYNTTAATLLGVLAPPEFTAMTWYSGFPRVPKLYSCHYPQLVVMRV